MPPPPRISKRPLWATIALVVVAAAFYLIEQAGPPAPPIRSGQPSTAPAYVPASPTRAEPGAAPQPRAQQFDGGIARLYAARQSDQWVEAEGRVVKVLPDDNSTDNGTNARHERLLVEVAPNLTVLIAHNTDIAPRVPAAAGDRIRFRGQYEWSDKGGTVHFTHAPKYRTRNSDERGWIEHNGRRYE